MAMTTIEKSLEVGVPVRAAYNQWTQFEDFPRFMEGVEEVHQTDERHLHWRAKIGGVEKEWEAIINEQIPDERIAWHSIDGAPNAGTVLFHRMADNKTKVTLELGYDPDGFVESVGDKLGFVSRQVDNDLKHFKEFVETRGMETGGWRGEIHRGEQQGSMERRQTSGATDPASGMTPGPGEEYPRVPPDA